MDVTVSKMTQMQKTMLRYQYVLANTGAVQDDFAANYYTWANQIRILTGSFQALGSVVGGVIVNALKPFIVAMNQIMISVIGFAETVSNALGAIFGWTYESGGGIATDLELGASAADDLEDATGGAAKNAKELNKYIAGWQEVNNMTSSEDTSGSGRGGAGTDLTQAGSNGEWMRTDKIVEGYISGIKQLETLGQYISNSLTTAMKSIDWNSVYNSAKNFGSGLANFLNGLISPQLFGETGKTIAGALNTVFYGLNSYGQTFDWTEFGQSIATGINNFFTTFDFANAADTLNTFAQGLWNAIKEAIQKIEWDTVLDGIGDFIDNIDIDTVNIIIGAFLFKDVSKILKNSLISALAGGVTLPSLITTISTITISSGFLPTGPAFDLVGSSIVEGINRFIETHFGEKALESIGISLSMAVAGGLITLGNPIGILAGGIVGLLASAFTEVDWSGNIWEKIKEKLFNFSEATALWETAEGFFENAFNSDDLLEIGENIIAGVASGLTSGLTYLVEPILDLFDFVIKKICEAFGIESPAKEMEPYGEYILLGIAEGFTASFSEWYNKIFDWYTKTSKQFKEKIDDIKSQVTSIFSDLPQKIYDVIIKIKEKISEWKEKAISFFKTDIPEIVTKVIEFFGELPTQIVLVGENVISGLWEGIENKVDWIWSKIKGFCSNMIGKFEDGLDEHSPSKEAYRIGDYFTLGLSEGLTNRFSDVYKEVKTFSEELTSIPFDFPTVDIGVNTDDYNYEPIKVNSQALSGNIHESIDYALASGLIDYERLGDAMYRAQTQAMKENPLKVGDKEVFSAAQRQQRREYRQTFKTGWAGID